MRSKLAHLGIAVTAALIPCHIESAFVFYHREKGESAGHRFTELKRAWQKLLKEASIDNLRFHDLRHTCALWLVMKSVPLQTVQQILGHKSFVTTLRYPHMAPELRIEAAERLCEVADGHFLDTRATPLGGVPLRPAANDGTTRSNGEGGGDRTHDPRLKKPLLYR